MKVSKKTIFYILFFVAVVFIFYGAVSWLIPGYSDRKLEPISKVRSFAFTNQDGKVITNKDVAGKVYVAEFFFTTCPGICPMMNDNMKSEIYDRYKNRKDFVILSHTCDPKNDSPAVLKRYADSMNVNTTHWIFLTGRKDSLYNMARLSYTIDDPANNLKNAEDDFLHTQFWALVNRKGEVLGIYDALENKEIKKLKKDIDKALKES
ncbi:MAG TPA: SCO family protein [Niabella sp.]|nr:SCO family protein [Niabella sp.]HOZ97920.1 SCO family protein [Niabella sp.]HQW15934.1 SCO family protein [Niabella sp.]HQX21118.1 SCO family protein [Niabella sp.]HQX40566.1 SCO family protein [Niabella sp.]